MKKRSESLKLDQEYIRDLIENETKDINETGREISRQLNFSATVLISFSALFFANNNIVSSLSILQKRLIFLSWILLVLSIASGIAQFYCEYLFLSKSARVKQEGLDKFAEDKIKTEEERTALYEGFKISIPLLSNYACTIIQVIFISIGTFTLLTAFTIQIFK